MPTAHVSHDPTGPHESPVDLSPTTTTTSLDDRKSPAAAAHLDGHQRSSLEALHPHLVLPDHYSLRVDSLSVLRRIERLRVTRRFKRDRHTVYEIAVVHHETASHIPYHDPRWRPQHPPAPRPPDAVVARPFRDFLRLRDALFYLTTRAHGLDPCPFCMSLFCFGAFGEVTPHRTSTWFRSPASVCAQLTQYLGELRGLVEHAAVFDDESCAAQDQIPIILELFLLTDKSMAEIFSMAAASHSSSSSNAA